MIGYERSSKTFKPEQDFPWHTDTMKPGQCLCVCVLLVLSMAGHGHGGNILVWYTEGSHWINLKPVLETLIDRGHQVTVLIPSSSLFMNASEPSRFHYEPFNSSVPLEIWEEIMEEFIHFSTYEMDHLSYIQIHIKFLEIMKKELKFCLQHLDSMVRSDTMARLREGKFDLLLADPIYPGSELVAEVLDLPLVYTLRFSIAHTWERLCGQLPAPPSYVPGAMSKLTDEMDFTDRLWNFLFYASQDMFAYHVWRATDQFYSEFTGEQPSVMLSNKL